MWTREIARSKWWAILCDDTLLLLRFNAVSSHSGWRCLRVCKQFQMWIIVLNKHSVYWQLGRGGVFDCRYQNDKTRAVNINGNWVRSTFNWILCYCILVFDFQVEMDVFVCVCHLATCFRFLRFYLGKLMLFFVNIVYQNAVVLSACNISNKCRCWFELKIGHDCHWTSLNLFLWEWTF